MSLPIRAYCQSLRVLCCQVCRRFKYANAIVGHEGGGRPKRSPDDRLVGHPGLAKRRGKRCPSPSHLACAGQIGLVLQKIMSWQKLYSVNGREDMRRRIAHECGLWSLWRRGLFGCSAVNFGNAHAVCMCKAPLTGRISLSFMRLKLSCLHSRHAVT